MFLNSSQVSGQGMAMGNSVVILYIIPSAKNKEPGPDRGADAFYSVEKLATIDHYFYCAVYGAFCSAAFNFCISFTKSAHTADPAAPGCSRRKILLNKSFNMLFVK
jgi:hypothetical protein